MAYINYLCKNVFVVLWSFRPLAVSSQVVSSPRSFRPLAFFFLYISLYFIIKQI
jgi:hypothetical protein